MTHSGPSIYLSRVFFSTIYNHILVNEMPKDCHYQRRNLPRDQSGLSRQQAKTDKYVRFLKYVIMKTVYSFSVNVRDRIVVSLN